MTDRTQARGKLARLAIVEFIDGHRRETGQYPTIRVIAHHLGRSVSTTHRHVQVLKRKGTLPK